MDIRLQLDFWELMINTWFVMLVLVGASVWITRRMRRDLPLSGWQHAVEMLVETLDAHLSQVAGEKRHPYTPFVGTLFLFIAATVMLGGLPSFRWGPDGRFAFYHSPTAQAETTVALALCVFFAVPYFAIRRRGVRHWLATYLQPTPFMLPFNILGDISRTVALAARLFGNMMSGTVIAALLLGIAPFFFPVIMQLFGLLTGLIQAYIFAILTIVYITSAVQIERQRQGVLPRGTRPTPSAETHLSEPEED